jgi:hypothetical protein
LILRHTGHSARVLSLALLLALPAVGLEAQAGGGTSGEQDLIDRLVPSVGITLGTTGIGVEAGVRPLERLGFRLGMATIPYTYDFEEDDVRGRGEPPSPATRLTVDFLPRGGPFHLSAGLHRVGQGVRAEAMPVDSIEFNDRNYSPEEIGSLVGEVWGKKTAPYLGLGWQGTGGSWQFYGDIGVVLTGSLEVDLRATGPISENQQFRQDLEAERRELQDDLPNIPVFPHLVIGLRYRIGG